MSSSKSRWPARSPTATRSSPPATKAKGILQIGHICRFNPRYRMAKQAIDAGRIGKIVSLRSRRNIPAAWTPTILNKIGPIVGDAIHDTDLMLWFTGDRVVERLCPDGRRARPQASRHRPDHVPLRRRRHGDAGDGVVHAGEDAVRHRRAHVDHRHRRHHPHPGHLPQSRHRRRATSCTAPTPPTGRCSTACAAARCATEFAYFANCALSRAKGRRSARRKTPRRRSRRRSPPRNRRAPVRS